VSGPTGVGKTTLSTQFMKEAAGRGTLRHLSLRGEQGDVPHSVARGKHPGGRDDGERTLQVNEVEALERSPQEFGRMVREEVEERGADIVMIDGIAGYRLTLRGEEG